MKPVRLPASAAHTLPRWGLYALCLLYILPGLIGRDPWKNDDAISFGVMWTMAHGNLHDWLWPHVVGLPLSDEGPLAYWIGAICIKLFGWFLGEPMAARVSAMLFFLIGASSVWYCTYILGRRTEVQPLQLAFGGQPDAPDFGRMLADGALLIYLGFLGLLLHSHENSPAALQVSLIAFILYASAKLFISGSFGSAAMLGLALGLSILTRGWLMPLALLLSIVILAAFQSRKLIVRLFLATLPVMLLVTSVWVIGNYFVQPFDGSPVAAWMLDDYHELSWPTWNNAQYFLVNGVWFAWPAWPFAAWTVYAWRKQYKGLHITIPLVFVGALSFLVLLNQHPKDGVLLPLLPPLAILAAFGLPTMKRGAINAIDWFSVMILSTCAGFIWLGWIAKQTGWPTQIAKNAFKLAPGFKPEFNTFALVVAVLATVFWLALVHWRIARRPAVIWRAVVLSSGGVILCWLLLMTLWMPWINYGKSYAGVAVQIALKLPSKQHCVDTNVGAAQRASFAYFGKVAFAQFDEMNCGYLLLQDNPHNKNDANLLQQYDGQWRILWEGRRPSDRDERFRLYRRIR
ncbi:MAG: glycosyltransferase [bacterium]